jgi:predicted nucleotidyltransferase
MRKTDDSGNGFDAGITADMKSVIKRELENLEKQEGFTILLFQLAKEYFSLRDTMNHYLGLTKKSLLSNPGANEIKLKQYFYILRPLLAAMWIVKYREIPPMEFHDLLQLIETPKLLEHIDVLLKKKAQAGEKDKISSIPDVQEFIEIQYERCKKNVQQFTSFKQGPEPLDSLFRNMLQRVAAK